MKANIHPQYQQANVICSCGNTFTVGSTKGTIHVELCYNCHPFYTGKARFVDSASRIDRFKKKQEAATAAQYIKKKKDQAKQDNQGPQTLRDMLSALKH